jgi:predicted PurR-regulated permease PerM
VFLAGPLGAALEPVVAAIRGRTGSAAACDPGCLLVFLAAVVGMAVFIVPPRFVQLSAALARLPEFLNQVQAWANNLKPGALADGVSSLVSAARAPFEPGPPPSPDAILGVSLIVGQATAAIVTLLFLVFFWLTERSRLQR